MSCKGCKHHVITGLATSTCTAPGPCIKNQYSAKKAKYFAKQEKAARKNIMFLEDIFKT